MTNESILDIDPGTERIDKKEYLNNKRLKKVIIPDSVKEIGDYAFAYCDRLRYAELHGDIVLGREVFKGCEELKEIYVRGTAKETAALLSAIKDDAPYLLTPNEVGSDEWIRKWDARMLDILHTADDDGYSNQIMCGEEDYMSTDLEGYKVRSAKRKIRIIFLRLINDIGLKDDIRDEISRYIKENPYTKDVVINEFGDEKEYYELFASLGLINEDNYEEILRDTGDQHTEMKAFFIRFMDEKRGLEKKDFFDMLKL